VKALTGIDPDRLKEEKEREMTIDLGFAWMTLPNGETVSIVDVPGHEDFIKNMLAGVGGIDAALLVVAADEGPMPQTREHLAILDLLNVRTGVVALTKIDLVDEPDWLDLVQTEVEELLAPTTLAHAPIVRVSARTGEGLEALQETLAQVLATSPSRPDLGRPRLSIDRAFTVAGFGTVVTGTLIDGYLRIGDEVEILPKGLRARIRGLQTHKRKIKTAVPGSRVAINLSGVAVDALERGDVVTHPGWLQPTLLIDVQLRVLPDAPKPLEHNQEVELFVGAAQVMARTRILGAQQLNSGETGWAQLRLARPVAVTKDDRFIVRQPSPSRTLGGGIVVDPHPRRKHRRFREEVIRRLEALASGSPEDVLLGTLLKQEPLEARRVVRRSNLEPEAAASALEALRRRGEIVALNADDLPGERLVHSNAYLVSRSGWQRLVERITRLLAEYHAQYPLRIGMPRQELRSRLRLEVPLASAIIDRCCAEGWIVEAGENVRLPTHEVRFTPEQKAQIEKLLTAFAASPYTPPSVAEAEDIVGADVLYALIEQGTLVRVREDVLFDADTYHQMVERITNHLREHGTITVAQARDMFGTSRKYALALLEHLDDIRVTKRIGDERVLR